MKSFVQQSMKSFASNNNEDDGFEAPYHFGQVADYGESLGTRNKRNYNSNRS